MRIDTGKSCGNSKFLRRYATSGGGSLMDISHADNFLRGGIWRKLHIVSHVKRRKN
jgi:hypothetical protein